MEEQRITNRRIWLDSRTFLVLVLPAVALLFLALGVLSQGAPNEFGNQGMATANRLANQLMSVALTSIALVIPLSSNLYSPKLVRVFLSHPLITSGLTLLVLTQAVIMSTLFLGKDHRLFAFGNDLSYFLTYLCLIGVLPFLFFVSHFLRPSFFMPLLTRSCMRSIQRLESGKSLQASRNSIFETADVITNIALTSTRRGDRRLILLSLRELHALLLAFIEGNEKLSVIWAKLDPVFTPGLVREGREYLREAQLWPEAYILAKILEIMEQVDKNQHQVFADTAHLLVQSTQVSLNKERADLIELHVLVFNALMRMSVEERDLRKFQNLSYHYRLLVEILVWDPMWMEEVVKHLVHYSRLAAKNNMPVAFETVLYDLAEVTLSLVKIEEHMATQFVEQHAGQIWFDTVVNNDHTSDVAWRSLARVYWEAMAGGVLHLCVLVRESYLGNEGKHRQVLEKMLAQNRPLHWEFNDRLLRMAYLTPEAEQLAWEFLNGQELEALESSTLEAKERMELESGVEPEGEGGVDWKGEETGEACVSEEEEGRAGESWLENGEEAENKEEWKEEREGSEETPLETEEEERSESVFENNLVNKEKKE